LLKTDNELDGVLGLAVFYQYVRTAALSQQQQTQHVSVFNTELFAHYLCIRCLSVMHGHPLTPSSLPGEFCRYNKRVCESFEMYTTDVLAFKLVCAVKYSGHFRKPMFAKHKTKPVTAGQLDTTDLVELLKQSRIRSCTSDSFSSARGTKVWFSNQDCHNRLRGAVRVQSGEYQRCLLLSMHNVRSLLGGSVVQSVVFAYPEFIQLMDDDVVSLIGLMLIVDPLCREKPLHISVCQLVLSLYLMTQCQIKLHDSVPSLAQTLNYIEVSRQQVRVRYTLDQLLFNLTERILLSYLSYFIYCRYRLF